MMLKPMIASSSVSSLPVATERGKTARNVPDRDGRIQGIGDPRAARNADHRRPDGVAKWKISRLAMRRAPACNAQGADVPPPLRRQQLVGRAEEFVRLYSQNALIWCIFLEMLE